MSTVAGLHHAHQNNIKGNLEYCAVVPANQRARFGGEWSQGPLESAPACGRAVSTGQVECSSRRRAFTAARSRRPLCTCRRALSCRRRWVMPHAGTQQPRRAAEAGRAWHGTQARVALHRSAGAQPERRDVIFTANYNDASAGVGPMQSHHSIGHPQLGQVAGPSPLASHQGPVPAVCPLCVHCCRTQQPCPPPTTTTMQQLRTHLLAKAMRSELPSSTCASASACSSSRSQHCR